MLGAADIARRAVLPAIAASSNGAIVALGSRTPERARQFLDPYREARVCESYDELLERSDIDAVYIPLVNSLHQEWTVRALDSGKHVLCEKPLAMNAVEAESMAAAARRAGKFLMEAFMYRFLPEMKVFIDQLADPLHVQASFGFRLTDSSNYRMQAALGGGALLDVGCYTVSVARWILGEPAGVMARAHVDEGIEMSVTALLEFSGGRTASLFASFESPEVQELRVVAKDRVHERAWPFGSRDEPNDPYRLMVESFGDSVLRDKPVAIPPEESIANMKVLDRIRAAAVAKP